MASTSAICLPLMVVYVLFIGQVQSEDGPCDPTPCLNGGQCLQTEFSLLCQCTEDYMGSTCESYIDPCVPTPCQNEGNCTRVSASSFTCQCPPDYTGDTCETEKKYCSLSYNGQLTAFSEEVTEMNVPCRYVMTSMQCGIYDVKTVTDRDENQDRLETNAKLRISGKLKYGVVDGRKLSHAAVVATTESVCETKLCFRQKKNSAIVRTEILLTANGNTWEADFDFNNFEWAIMNDSLTMNYEDERPTASAVTTDNVLNFTVSEEEGIKVMCADAISSKGYPGSLCGSGGSLTAGRSAINKKKNKLSYTRDTYSEAFDYLAALTTVLSLVEIFRSVI